jgi:hypothetical protein
MSFVIVLWGGVFLFEKFDRVQFHIKCVFSLNPYFSSDMKHITDRQTDGTTTAHYAFTCSQ